MKRTIIKWLMFFLTWGLFKIMSYSMGFEEFVIVYFTVELVEGIWSDK